MTLDPKDIRIVLGRTKTGHVYASSGAAAPAATEDLLAQLPGGESQNDAPTPSQAAAGRFDGDGEHVLAWERSLAHVRETGTQADWQPPPWVRVLQTAADYRAAVDASVSDGRLSAAPVLASRYAADSFTDGVRVTSPLECRDADPQRLCLALEDPVCVAAGTLLAAFAGRELRVVAQAEWDERLARALSSSELSSLTLLLPFWDDQGALDPSWLSTVTHLCSEDTIAEGGPRVGVLTGPDPGALTNQVAKTLFAHAIAERYRSKPALAIAPSEDAVSGLDPWQQTCTSGIYRFDPGATGLDKLLDEAFSAVLFRGHGRSYCSCEGYLCSARPPEFDARSKTDWCLFGLDCSKSSFPRTDVRRYDALLMVLDTCGAGNPDSGLDRAGVPPLSVLAAAAKPVAVVASRYLLRNDIRADEAQVVAAFAGASSAGEGVARLNVMRRQAGLSGDYYLLGDPELPSWMWRGEQWADAAPATLADAQAGEWHAHLEHSEAPYARVEVERQGEGTWFVWGGQGRRELGPATVLRHDEIVELWLSRPRGAGGHLDLWLACKQRRGLPSGVARSAARIGADGSWWLEPLQSELARLVSAGRQVQECEERQRIATAIARWSPAEDTEMSTSVVNDWLLAQRGCIEAVVAQRDELFLSWRFAGVHKGSAEVIDEPCLWCERSPTVRHRYPVTSVVERESRECNHCETILDRPIRHTLAVEFDAPSSICFPEPQDVVLRLSNLDPDTTAVGSAAVFVDNGATVRGSPEVFSFKLEPGERQAHAVTLEFEGRPRAAMPYGLRVVALVNNELYWFGRKFVVTDEPRRAAMVWG